AVPHRLALHPARHQDMRRGPIGIASLKARQLPSPERPGMVHGAFPEGPAHGTAIGSGELPFGAGGHLVGERPERKWPCRHVALLLGQRRQDLRALSVRWRVSTDEDEE